MPEAILEPERPIIDPHHHLWDRRPRTRQRNVTVAAAGPDQAGREKLYLLEHLLQDIGCGHNVRATVFIECRSMYTEGATDAMREVGETEFVNGVAAMSASGIYGPARACAGIVGRVDLRLGTSIEKALQAHIRAGGGRFRGIRQWAASDSDPSVLGSLAGLVPAGLYRDPDFRKGFGVLDKLGLTFDAWVLEPQLADVIDLARAFPDTQIILDHVGTPVGMGVYKGTHAQRFDGWAAYIRTLARCDNVVVKLGGLGMAYCGFPWHAAQAPASATLADAWKPYVETCIEAFGPTRCMFESNFPVDSHTCDYATLWNAFKRIAAGCSEAEKDALFFATAAHVYRLEINR